MFVQESIDFSFGSNKRTSLPPPDSAELIRALQIRTGVELKPKA